MLKKIRLINTKDEVYGINIPKKVALFVKETHFHIERRGPDIILRSGAPQEITQKQLEKYQYEDCLYNGS